MPEIDFTEPQRTKLRLNGKPIWSMRFESEDLITVKNVLEFIRDYDDGGENPFDDFKFKVNINYQDTGWRTRSTWITTDDLENQDSLWAGYEDDDDDEYRKLNSFELLLIRKPEPEGGADEHNDCLYNAIKQAFPFSVGRKVNVKSAKGKWKTTIKRLSKSDLKELLKIGRDDPVDYRRIPEIEDELQVRIHVVGDFEYTSGKTHFDRLLTVSLTNGHYKYVPPISQKELFTPPSKEPCTLITRLYQSENSYLLFDGDREYQSEGITSVSKDKFIFEVKSKEELRTKHEERMKNVRALAKETGGYMDLSRFMFRTSLFVKSYFSKFSKLYPADPIDQVEALWISKASGGGLNWANKNTTLKNAYQYDINSFYPSIMKGTFTFPVRRGKFVKFEVPSSGFYPYGIFRVHIENINSKLVQKRKNNYYTQYDINRAIETGAQVSLIEDGEANALLYDETTRVKANGLFKTMIERLYGYKKQGLKCAKEILNNIWGSLCQKNTITKTLRDGDCMNFRQLKNAYPKASGRLVSGILYDEEYDYKTAYARMGPFLTGLGRSKLSKMIEPYLENIHYVNTDGFISEKELPLKLSTNLGGMKLEQSGECQIIHSKKKLFKKD